MSRSLVAAALALAATAARADGAPGKLALDALAVRGGVGRELATAVEGRVCQALAEAAKGADLVCPEDVAAAAVMARNEALMGHCASDACMQKVEALKAAPRRVGGTLEREGKAVVLTLVLAEEGAARPRTATGKFREDELLAGVPGLVNQLF